jgi:MFS transporter, FSR family, fosmidomycin resistance protein
VFTLTATAKLKLGRVLRAPLAFVFTLLAIEFFDELAFGVREAAWPLIRDDLGLTYAQIGLLLSLPNIASSLIEPVLGVLGDTWKRWLLIAGGGLAFAATLFLTSLAPSFVVLLAAFTLMYPASGAFVSLSEASLMDTDPTRHEQLMARWNLAGSVGVVAGPLMLGGAVWLGLDWRLVFLLLGGVALLLTALTWHQPRFRRRAPASSDQAPAGGLRAGLRRAVASLRRPDVLRWLTLLAFSDLMLDVLLSFVALYFVDVAGVSIALAGTAVAVWSGVGLLGDALVIPLLERVRGLVYIRWSAALVLLVFPAFLLAGPYGLKLLLLAVIRLCVAGWYPTLSGQLYSSMPGQSGTVVAVAALFGLATGFVPAGLWWVAGQAGLPSAMWLLLLGPLALLLALGRKR